MEEIENLFFVDSPLYKLEYTAHVCHRYYLKFFKENFSGLGITPGEHAVMDTIVRSPEISQIELARLLFKGRSHITQILKSLEEKKFITRTNEVKNGRKISKTVLTPAGKEVYKTIKLAGYKKFIKMCKYFDEKEEIFVNILSEIREILTEGETVTFD